MQINKEQLRQAVPIFISQRLEAGAPAHIRWLLGGATFLIDSQFNNIMKRFSPLLLLSGIATQDGDNLTLDVDKLKDFLNASFTKQPSVDFMGFKFNQEDANALCRILEEKANGQ